MIFGNGSAESMAAADAAKAAVRSTANFNWTFIALLAVVIVGIWIPQWKKKNYNGMAAALALYGVHWLYEIANAVIETMYQNALNDYKLDDKEIRAKYNENIKNYETVTAKHILVSDENKAKDLYNQLKRGADFDKLMMAIYHYFC